MKYNTARRSSTISLFSIGLMALAMPAQADEKQIIKKDWRAEYEAMDDKQRDAFNKKRADIKSQVNQMSNEEREAFKRQIESQHGVAAGDTIYIEAMPQEDTEVFEPEERPEEEAGWNALSFEEKRDMYFGKE